MNGCNNLLPRFTVGHTVCKHAARYLCMYVCTYVYFATSLGRPHIHIAKTSTGYPW